MDDDETFEIDEADDGVVDTPDGGAIVTLDDGDENPASDEHFANLAETLPDDELNRLATSLLEMIGRDKEARKKRDEQYEEGIRRTGLGDDAPGGAKFAGASKVVHPMLVEATVDFEARAMKELWPAGGPAQSYVPGDPTEERLEKAERKARLLNWQLTVQCQNARAEVEQLLTQLPLGGSQYLKLWWDDKRNRPEFLFVPIDEMYLPFAASNFYTAQRKTHVQYITQLEYERRVESGMYRDADLPKPGMEPEQSAAAKANDRVEGRESTAYNEDGLRTVYECYVTAEVDGLTAPYIVSIDVSTRTVLAVYRNWSEEDDSLEELQWFVEWSFVPWRGVYAIGLPHMIGGLSAAATGALRALLDSAHINNIPSGIRLKGKIGGQSLNIQPTQIADVEGSAMVDDVRKVFMPLPFNPPSATLFELLGFIVDAGQSVVRTTFENLADQSPNAPVGTTVALIEQGMVVYSAIHERCHDSMARMLRILHRLNADNLDEGAVVDEAGQLLARRGDFTGPMDVVPVSDPHVFSETQRFAQASTVVQRAALSPDLYDRREAEQYFLETLRIPNADRFLVPNMEPKEENAVRENVLASVGKALVAMPRQDHIAHLKAHIAYMMSPALGMSPLIAPKALPILLDHLSQHIAMWYSAMTYALIEQTSGVDVEKERKMVRTAEDRRAFDRMLAEAATLVVEEAASAFSELPAAIQQAQQLVQQLQQAQPQDPVAVAMADVQRKAQADGQKAQIESQGLKLEALRDQLDAQSRKEDRDAETRREQMRQIGESQRAGQNNQSREGMNDADNATAIELANMDVAGKVEVAKAKDFGPNPNQDFNPEQNPDRNPKP